MVAVFVYTNIFSAIDFSKILINNFKIKLFTNTEYRSRIMK